MKLFSEFRLLRNHLQRECLILFMTPFPPISFPMNKLFSPCGNRTRQSIPSSCRGINRLLWKFFPLLLKTALMSVSQAGSVWHMLALGLPHSQNEFCRSIAACEWNWVFLFPFLVGSTLGFQSFIVDRCLWLFIVLPGTSSSNSY